ncbi:hypothetical protein EII12_10360 [Buchananella hordeovulneris]|uniref:DUF1963 domain-containing protein n=1 Tax=Buchananella hordeovulneris TaxID=52770 RepID=A0A1Q5PYU5_9ACTO|nr:hypothetical protein [Buchananella hordeovulneris]OKL52801.1 hypothetical protein BSZ40_01485 [Buchananella hordeovulneris]RRD49652.1 hypothetical protein EII12_10360 [Buchananella hordeovulneris]
MQTFFPTWSLTPPSTAGPTTAHKVGGLPLGFPPHLWPTCRECGQPQSFLGQFAAHPALARLPAGHTLYLFKCDSDNVCFFWEPEHGANACFLLPHSELTAAPTPAPPGNTGVLLELWATAWRAQDDGVPAELEPQFYDERFFDLPEETAYPLGFDGEVFTKAAGLPYWALRGGMPADFAPGSRVLLQLDYRLQVADGAAALAAGVAAASDYLTGYTEVDDDMVGIANFLLDGVGYVVDTTPSAPAPTFRLFLTR